VVGALHVYGEGGAARRLDGLDVKRYRLENHFFATLRGGAFNAPAIDTKFPPTRSSLDLQVDEGAWGFTTRSPAPAPGIQDPKERYDVYDGYIHIPESR
jgi:hypothetical protein